MSKYKVPYICASDPFGYNKVEDLFPPIVKLAEKYNFKDADWKLLTDTIEDICSRAFVNGMSNKAFED